MEIHNHPQVGSKTATEVEHTNRAVTGRSQATGQSGESGAHGDRVTLTDAVQKIIQQSQAHTGAPVNQDKVDALRDAISQGSYQVDATKVANRLVDLHNS